MVENTSTPRPDSFSVGITTPAHEWVEEGVFRLLAKHFPNGNHGDYVDWINTDTVVIDGTYDLESLAEDIQTLLDTHTAHLVERAYEDGVKQIIAQFLRMNIENPKAPVNIDEVKRRALTERH